MGQCSLHFIYFFVLTFGLGSFATCRLSRSCFFFWLPYYTLAVVVFFWIATPSSIISGFCLLGSNHCIVFKTLSQYVRGIVRFGISTSWIILKEKVWLQLSSPACWLLWVRFFYLFSSQADWSWWEAFQLSFVVALDGLMSHLGQVYFTDKFGFVLPLCSCCHCHARS